jgi:phosphate transport system substrate-binding protein
MIQKVKLFKVSFWGAILFISLCSSISATANENSLRIAGSTTVLPIVSRAAENFKIKHPNISITVNAGGSGVGFSSVADNRVDIGMMSRKISENERKKYNNQEFKVHILGRDGVACVVSSEIYSAGVTTLSKEQIGDIYSGKIKNWKDLGGPDKKIVVVDKERHRGTRHAFMHYVFGNPTARARGARLVSGSNNEEQAKIAQSDSAIGLLSLAWVNKDVVGVALRNEGEEIEPSIENIKSGVYPISRDLDIVTQKNVSDDVKLFIEFLLGSEVRPIIEKSGYVPIR